MPRATEHGSCMRQVTLKFRRPIWSRIHWRQLEAAEFTPRSRDLNYCLNAVADVQRRVPRVCCCPHCYHHGLVPVDFTQRPPAPTRFDKTANKALSVRAAYPTDPNITPEFSQRDKTKRFVLENGAANNPVGKPVTADGSAMARMMR